MSLRRVSLPSVFVTSLTTERLKCATQAEVRTYGQHDSLGTAYEHMPSPGSREQSGAAARPRAVGKRRGSGELSRRHGDRALRAARPLDASFQLWEQHLPCDRADDLVPADSENYQRSGA